MPEKVSWARLWADGVTPRKGVVFLDVARNLVEPDELMEWFGWENVTFLSTILRWKAGQNWRLTNNLSGMKQKKINKCQLIWDFTNLNWLIDGVHFLGGEYCVTLGAW